MYKISFYGDFRSFEREVEVLSGPWAKMVNRARTILLPDSYQLVWPTTLGVYVVEVL